MSNSLNKDGFRAKMWETKKGKIKGGGKFTAPGVLRILKSRLYTGEYEYEGKYYSGIHQSIIDIEVEYIADKKLEADWLDIKMRTLMGLKFAFQV